MLGIMFAILALVSAIEDNTADALYMKTKGKSADNEAMFWTTLEVIFFAAAITTGLIEAI